MPAGEKVALLRRDDDENNFEEQRRGLPGGDPGPAAPPPPVPRGQRGGTRHLEDGAKEAGRARRILYRRLRRDGRARRGGGGETGQDRGPEGGYRRPAHTGGERPLLRLEGGRGYARLRARRPHGDAGWGWMVAP